MLEKSVIARVIRKVQPYVVSHSLTGAAMTANGIPDRYFDLDTSHPMLPASCTGSGGDLWLEFKVCRSKADVLVKGEYTPMQRRWLARRYANGGNAFGVVAIEHGRHAKYAVQRGLLYELENGTPARLLFSAEEVAQWITDWCCGSQRWLSKP